MLTINGLHTAYGGLKALDNVTIRVGAGQFVAIVGPNGAGKTTLFKSISGTVMPAQGDIQWQGQSIMALPAAKRPELGIAHVPEGRQMFKELSVLENLEMGAQTAAAKQQWSRNLDQVLTLFPVLGERRNQLAGTLSGGEQQMVAIGRGLMSAPKLLMLDEPSMGLAPKITDMIFERIEEIHKNTDIAILLVEQRVAEALASCDYGYVLQSGRIALEGTPETLMKDETVRSVYLGL
jgi:branched-chain amino acid transport system ATP-binding protein